MQKEADNQLSEFARHSAAIRSPRVIACAKINQRRLTLDHWTVAVRLLGAATLVAEPEP